MLPILFSIGTFTLHSYGLMMAVGFVAAVVLMRSRAKREGIEANHLVDIALLTFVAGLAGGRILFVLTNLSTFANQPLEALRFWNGGLVFYGGLVTGVAALAWLSRRFQIPIPKALDIAAPAAALAHAFGRIGCFAAGCCYGREAATDFPFGVVFHHPESLAPTGVPLHPAQLYDAFNCLVILAILLVFERRKKFDGQIFALYGMLYAVGRTIVETFRGDAVRGFVIPGMLSTSQFIAILVFTASMALWVVQARRKKQVAGPTESSRAS